jgi:hypothetical protein
MTPEHRHTPLVHYVSLKVVFITILSIITLSIITLSIIQLAPGAQLILVELETLVLACA